MTTKSTTLGESPLPALDGPLLGTILQRRRLPLRHQRMIARRLGRLSGWLIRRHVFARIRKTRALRVNPQADVEIHTVLCHRDVDMFLVAAKSLLRFCSDVAVVVHDDGTLHAADATAIVEHLPGARVIDRPAADRRMEGILRAHPACREYRCRRPQSFQLFDYCLLGDREKVLSLDSDVIFVREPLEIVEWLAASRRYVVFNQERGGTKVGRELIRRGIPCHGTLNSGVLGFFTGIVDLDLVEDCLHTLRGMPKSDYAQGYLDICLERSGLEARPLDPERYLVYMGQGSDELEDVAMVHFIGYLRFAQLFYARFALALMADLGRSATGASP
jgi:hypothetical protein